MPAARAVGDGDGDEAAHPPARAFLSPLQGSHYLYNPGTWGSRPRLIICRASGARAGINPAPTRVGTVFGRGGVYGARFRFRRSVCARAGSRLRPMDFAVARYPAPTGSLDRPGHRRLRRAHGLVGGPLSPRASPTPSQCGMSALRVVSRVVSRRFSASSSWPVAMRDWQIGATGISCHLFCSVFDLETSFWIFRLASQSLT